MTNEKEFFIKLLSSFANQSAPNGEVIDYGEVFRLADIHDVGGIIANQLKLLNEDYKPKNEYNSYFNQMLGYAVKNNAQRERAFLKLKSFLVKNDIEHIFVKGIIIKEYYYIPELRTSGDIDVIVRPEALKKFTELARTEGFKITKISSDTVTLNILNVEVEVHNNSDVLVDYFDGIFSLCERDNLEYKLNFNDHLFYVLCHIIKHIIYRGAGVRMLLDVDIMLRREEADLKRVLELSSEYNIEKAVKVILSLCSYWFNTPVEKYYDFTENKTLLNKLEIVFIDGGSFGFYSNPIPLKYYRNSNSKLGIFLKLAFPSKDYLKNCYPYYKNNHLLYPVARINRLTDGLFKSRKVAEKAMKQIIKDDSTQIQLDLIEELELKTKEQI